MHEHIIVCKGDIHYMEKQQQHKPMKKHIPAQQIKLPPKPPKPEKVEEPPDAPLPPLPDLPKNLDYEKIYEAVEKAIGKVFRKS